jgi:hypothetical protein
MRQTQEGLNSAHIHLKLKSENQESLSIGTDIVKIEGICYWGSCSWTLFDRELIGWAVDFAKYFSFGKGIKLAE